MKGVGFEQPSQEMKILERETGKEGRPVQWCVLTLISPLETKAHACQDSEDSAEFALNSSAGKEQGEHLPIGFILCFQVCPLTPSHLGFAYMSSR